MFKISTGRFFVVRDVKAMIHFQWLIVVSVSQFTLLASTKKGTKPDFHGALGGDQAKDLYQLFVSKLQQGYKAERVKDGVFQAMMVGSSQSLRSSLLTIS
jgi:D-tyrosyl-tRNA(Tyr) deacylase